MTKANIKLLFGSIRKGDSELLFQILDEYPNSINIYGQHNSYCRDKTPLMFSLQCHHFDWVDELIARGADINAKMLDGPKSSVIALATIMAVPIHSSYQYFFDFIKKIIELGVSPDEDALWKACYNYTMKSNRYEIIELFLSKGANPDVLIGNSGNTIRELISINSKKYSPDVLKLFNI